MTAEDLPEAERFMALHPEVNSVDLILFDTNGKERGKRIPISMLPKVVKHGLALPGSVFALDIKGETIEETGLGFEQGDSDNLCRLVPGSLRLIPWKEGVAQAVLTMLNDEQDALFFADPRRVLVDQLCAMSERELKPCVAIEYEFYLQDVEPDDLGQPQPPIMPLSQERMTQTQVYSLDELDEFQRFIDDVIAACEVQGVPASNIIAEYAPGQFEINLRHSVDVMQACDQAVLMKRVVRSIAKQHGFVANFMAKPYTEHSGNGCHVHISLFDNEDQNAFVKQPQLLQQSLAGILQQMPETLALLAPNANSYRRFQPDMFVSLWPNWGWDNRTTALRIPSDSEQNLRIEHRLAGADCNPYLVVAAILATLQEGIDEQLTPPEAIDGNAYEMEGENHLPLSWPQSLERFQASDVLIKRLGSDYCHTYYENKRAEQLAFDAQVTPLEYLWYR
ncbi:glutamine synthetase [Reinekea thalattae]|uniref:Glutamine synthetase n=2 Tax=Reinekea thalattae TaxID=2593301 RepID=A0A5C8ZB79_9GAMM|nr:glutamine synthetase [Reinekea thalattae]